MQNSHEWSSCASRVNRSDSITILSGHRNEQRCLHRAPREARRGLRASPVGSAGIPVHCKRERSGGERRRARACGLRHTTLGAATGQKADRPEILNGHTSGVYHIGPKVPPTASQKVHQIFEKRCLLIISLCESLFNHKLNVVGRRHKILIMRNLLGF